MINQSRRFGAFRTVLDVTPQAFQKADIGAKLVLARVLRCRTDDEASMAILALAEDDALQPLPFFFR